MSTPEIARLGHVGIHCTDLSRQKQFYTEVLGLQVTDEEPGLGMVFLSARPEEEHHEFLLCGGRNVADRDVRLLQQVSFRCNTLEDVVGFYHRLEAEGVEFDMVVSHGNAVGVYFLDPEGNRIEVYCATGLKARQPYLQRVDLNRPVADIMRDIEASVREHGAEGIIEPTTLEIQNLPEPQRA